MVAPKSVKVLEGDSYYRMSFEDDLPNKMTYDIEPDDRIITMGIGIKKDPSQEKPIADVAITDVVFPKSVYARESVLKTANVIDEKIKEGSCPPCVILSATQDTEKTFLFPTLRDLTGIKAFKPPAD